MKDQRSEMGGGTVGGCLLIIFPQGIVIEHCESSSTLTSYVMRPGITGLPLGYKI